MPVPFRIKPPEIPEAKPFEECALGREAFAKTLTTFVEHAATPLVLALDSGWGSGKTTFLKMWRAQLKLQGIPSAYFNAWESDYLEEPLVGLISEFAGELEAKEPARAAKVREVGKRVLKRMVPFAIRVATAGLVDIKDGEVEAALAEASQSLAEEQLNAYEERKREVTTLRQLLEEAASEAGSSSKPFVYLIDELDRCRPTFAIELLERIKHLFEVPGIIFVLALDRSQLQHSIRSVYGAEFDAAGYLRRFFDLVLAFPEPVAEGSTKRISDLLGWSAGGRYRHRDFRELAEYTELLCATLGATIRQREQVSSRVHLAILVRPENQQELYPSTLALLTSLHELRPQWLAGFLKTPMELALTIADTLYPDQWRPVMGNRDTLRYELEAMVWLLAAGRSGVSLAETRRQREQALVNRLDALLADGRTRAIEEPSRVEDVEAARGPLIERLKRVRELIKDADQFASTGWLHSKALSLTLRRLELAGEFHLPTRI